MSKTTGHTTSTFENYRLENRLLQDFGDEVDIIISNTVQSKSSPFIKFIRAEHHQLKFVTTIARKSTSVSHLHRYQTGTEFLMFQVVTGCHIKVKLTARVSLPLFTLLLQYGPPETSENARFCKLMAVSSWYSKY